MEGKTNSNRCRPNKMGPFVWKVATVCREEACDTGRKENGLSVDLGNEQNPRDGLQRS